MAPTKVNNEVKVAIAGAGLAGLTCALALVNQGASVTIFAPKTKHIDRRTTALLSGSVEFLETIGIWDNAVDKAAAMSRMRIIDDTGRLFRAPLLDFTASEIGLKTFGHNIENSVLTKALGDKISDLKNCEFVDSSISNAIQDENTVTLTLKDGKQRTFDILIGADGRNSATRTAMGTDAEQWDYPQSAVVFNVQHTISHNQASNEFHTPTGPLTTVPLKNANGVQRSSIVWVEAPDRALELVELQHEALNTLIETRTHSMLGKIKVEGKPNAFPLSGMLAKRFAYNRIFLVGEAAHVMPPIGAQGFNLGLRDVQHLHDNWLSISAHPEQGAQKYDASRKRDAKNRGTAVDAINRSLLSEFLPLQLPRTLGMHAMDTLTPLRRFIMREGLRPGDGFKSISNPLDLLSGFAKRSSS